MGNSRENLLLNTIFATLLLLLSFDRGMINAQISTACTTSMITSFTPCINFITGSSANGQTSPTADCCDSVRSLMSDSVDCACLIITGNVPFSLPFINRTLAISLPQACNGGVPLQCKSSGVPLPAPGPALFTPPQAPLPQAPAPSHAHAHADAPAPSHAHAHAHAPSPSHAHANAHAPFISPRASKASSTPAPAPPPIDDKTPGKTPVSPPKASRSSVPAAHPGIRPVVFPAASSSGPSLNSAYPLFPLLIAAVVFTFQDDALIN